MPTFSTTIRRGRALAVLAAAAMAFVLSAAGCTQTSGATGASTSGATGASTSGPGGASIPASLIGRLTAIAHAAATANSDPAPEWITVVKTTHSKALTVATPGDSVPGSGDNAVFLITMRGHFVANDVSRPLGAKAPAGRYLSLVLDAKTFQELDFGLDSKPPPVALAHLGRVTYLAGHRPKNAGRA
jgi:hypothetical protein